MTCDNCKATTKGPPPAGWAFIPGLGCMCSTPCQQALLAKRTPNLNATSQATVQQSPPVTTPATKGTT